MEMQWGYSCISHPVEVPMKRSALACFLALLFCPIGLTAAPVDVAGIVPNHTANGAELAGLLVTVTWDFGPLTTNPGIHSFTYTWVATGADSGGIFVTGPVPPFPIMTLTGNSATAAWRFTGLYADPVVSVMLDGTAAGILFDRALPDPGTPGTGTGNDALALIGLFATSASYSNPVGVAGAAPVGDLYSQLLFDFSGAPLFSEFSFTQSTVLAIPEPATSVLTWLGLALVASRLRRN